MAEKTKFQLGKEHTTERPELLSGNETFKHNGVELGFNVIDYWRFQFSNLVDNLGYVAEFLIAQALSKDEPDNCNGWTVYDLGYRGKRIEVKPHHTTSLGKQVMKFVKKEPLVFAKHL